MRKRLLSIIITSTLGVGTPLAVSANSADIGVAVSYGFISGFAFEMTYPINDLLQVRGILTRGMGLSGKVGSPSELEYGFKAGGSTNRLSLDFHPFAGSFFLSTGYVFNDFKLKTSFAGEDVEVGNTGIKGNVTINGAIKWDSAPILSLGWGHSPSEGWGSTFEMGIILTGSPKVSFKGVVISGTSTSAELNDALNTEAVDLQDNISIFSFIPILQTGITYRF